MQFRGSNYSKSEIWIKDYPIDSTKQFQMVSDKESELILPSMASSPDIIEKAKELIQESNCVWDLPKVNFLI